MSDPTIDAEASETWKHLAPPDDASAPIYMDEVAAPAEKLCPDCDVTEADLPGGPSLNLRIGRHRRQVHGVEGTKPKTRGRKVPRDTAPGSVRVELKSPAARAKKTDPALDRVEERARHIAEGIAVVLLLSQQHEDAADIERHKVPWSKSVRNLAEYEEWLKNLLSAGGESSDRVMAWLGFLIATGAMLTPILIRHDLVPAQVQQLLSMVPTEPPAEAPREPVAA